MDMSLIIEALPQYLHALVTTVELVLIALATGFLVSIPLAVMRVSNVVWLSKSVAAYTYFFRGTPLLIQLMTIYYGFGQFEWLQHEWRSGNPFWLLFREPYFCACLALCLNTAAYETELLAGAINRTPRGEAEAALAVGMSQFTMFRRIILPAALRRSIPAYSNEVIFVMHGTSLASAVTLVDLTGSARAVYSQYYAPFEAFGVAGALYLALTMLLVGIFKLAERRWLGHLRPRGS
jgi:arginine/ornithine transport system permease protein